MKDIYIPSHTCGDPESLDFVCGACWALWASQEEQEQDEESKK